MSYFIKDFDAYGKGYSFGVDKRDKSVNLTQNAATWQCELEMETLRQIDVCDDYINGFYDGYNHQQVMDEAS